MPLIKLISASDRDAASDLAAAMKLVKFKKGDGSLISEFKYSEKKAAENRKVEAQIRKAIEKFKLKKASGTWDERMGKDNSGSSGASVYEGKGVTLTWNRSFSYSNGTTYHRLTIKAK